MLTSILVVFALIVLVVITFLAGPRARIKARIPGGGFDPETLGPDPAATVAALAAAEARFTDIRGGLQKEIIWRDPVNQAETDWAVVYVHGFSASRVETQPLADLIADALDANLFYARLTGHGQTGEALAAANGEDWLRDAAEAIEVGRRIGQRVLIIGTSTGATAIAPAALDDVMGRDVAGLVFISPNFGIQARGSEWLTIPWGRQIAELTLGRARDATTDNEAYNAGWTTRYPTGALAPMMALVQHVRPLPFQDTTVPLLVLHAPDDKVVKPEETRKIFARWGGPKNWIDVTGTRGPTHHVIAGDIVNPDMTEPAARWIIDWARGLDSQG